MIDLSETQLRGLIELAAACDERIKYHGGEGWVRTFDLSGTKEERSSKNMLSLVDLGFAVAKKPAGSNQTQYSWKVTDAGRAIISTEDASND